MNETRTQIIDALHKEDLESLLFLTNLNSDALNQLIDAAAKERDTNEQKLDAEIANQLFGESILIGEENETEENFSDFISRIAYRVQRSGTSNWIEKLEKESAEAIINGMHSAGNCKITLENGDSFDEWKLVSEWEEIHGEALEKKGDWSFF